MKAEERKLDFKVLCMEIGDFIKNKKGEYDSLAILLALSMAGHASRMAFLVSHGEEAYALAEKLIKDNYGEDSVRKDLENYEKEKVFH